MKTDIWMPLYINDYKGATDDLDAEESGIYLHLLMKCWTNGVLPVDKKRLMRTAKIFDSEKYQSIEMILNRFFNLTDDGWRNKRVDEERQKVDAKSEKARESANRRWNSDANAMRTHSEGICESDAKAMLSQSQSHTESYTKKDKKKRGFDFSFIEDEEWRDVWKLWCDSKPSQYTKKIGVEKGYTHLINISDNDIIKAKAIVDNAIAQGWKGLYPPSPSKLINSTQSTHSTGPTYAKLAVCRNKCIVCGKQADLKYGKCEECQDDVD